MKLGGSVITDKPGEARFRRPATKRLLGELARAEVPAILLHGAGSFGHGPAARHRIGQVAAKPEGVAEVLAAVGRLHAEVVDCAADAGLRPLSFPLQHSAASHAGHIVELPVERLVRALEEGYVPVLCGSLVRDDQVGWRVVSADELMAALAPEVQPRLAVFVTNVDGILRGSDVLATVGRDELRDIDERAGGTDVTGGMHGKLVRALEVAACCPTWIIGDERGRLLDLLKGKNVLGTRVAA